MRRKTISLRTLGVATAVVLLPMLRAGAQSPVPVTFTENGPAGFTAHDHDGPNPWAGAISAVVPHPTKPDVMWIGAVNGGVWKTTNATHANPTWVPLTDHQASLSIGALALDSADDHVLVAGIGHPSFFNGNGGPLTGLLRTTNGGSHWEPLGQTQLAGQSIGGLVVNGNRIIASSGTGIWRSHDTGATFDHLGLETMPADCGVSSNIEQRRVSSLVRDPARLDFIYAAIPGSPGGAPGGVYESVDFGCSWDDISFGGTFGQPSGENLVAGAARVSLSVHDGGTHEAVYAAIVQDDALKGVFRSADRGLTWTALDKPPTNRGGNNLTILSDPISKWIFYIGGDARAFFRCNASHPRGSQCTLISGTGGTINGSAPHEDSRSMAFDAAGNLLESDDGGIFQRLLPRHWFGFWRSLNGNLSITETHSCAWDHLGHVAICGTQDNGVVGQQTAGAAVWKELTGADGGNVAASERLGLSIKYFSTQHLGGFQRTVCLALGCLTSTPSLSVGGINGPHLDDSIDPILTKGQQPYSVPIAAHALNPSRLVIATGSVYESDDAGDTLTVLGGKFTLGPATKAIAFGSKSLHDILYVGSPDGLFRHTTKFGPIERLETYSFGIPVVMTLDPDDWQSAWVINAPAGTPPNALSGNSIWHTPTGGFATTGQPTWTDVTANLGPGGLGAEEFHAIAFVPTRSGGIIFVGASDGLYARSTTPSACWFKLHGALPNAIVYDLNYDAADDVLLIATLGRGTWTIASPGNITLPTAVDVACNATVGVQVSPVSVR